MKTRIGLGGETVPDTTDDTLHSGTDPVRVARAATEPARGGSIGRFLILGVLGSGGMGLVYSAYDPHLDRKVAIKLLHATVRADANDARTRLLREAQAMAKINHPNVVKVHEVGVFEDQVYVAMEFADAGTVRAWLKEQPRALREIVDVFVQAGRGIAAAHAANLVHRDFKPDNVLMAKDGSVRVTDFGLVSVLGAAAIDQPPASSLEVSLGGTTPLSQDLTQTGAIMGTPTYMAPEQFSGAVATASTDQFSFCVALYEAVYDERPFAGGTYPELAANVLVGEVAAPPKTTRVPSWLRRVLLRGLSVTPPDRYPSMAELLAALSRDPARRRRRWVGGGIVAALVATGALVFALRPNRGGECASGDDRVAVGWNAERRTQMKAAFDGSKRPHAAVSFGRVTELLDTWSGSWEVAYRDACKDTRVRGDQSEHLLDLRMQCLTRRLDDARATIDLLATGGGDVVDHAIDAVLALPSVAPCSNVDALLAGVPPPDTAIIALQVVGVRARLDEARGLSRLGRYARGLDVAQPALATARAVAYKPLTVEALLAVGRLQLSLGNVACIDTFREAMHVAAEAGDASRVVDASAVLVFALATQSSHYDLAEEIAALADATASHARPDVEIAVGLDNAVGLLLEAQGKAAAAQVRFEKGLARAEKELGPDHPAVLRTLLHLGNLAKSQGRFPEARKLLERALAAQERISGKEHPDVASPLSNLGNVYRVEGKLDMAKQLYDRALAIRIAGLGPDHPDVAASLNNLGNLSTSQGDYAAAERYQEKALAIWEKTYGLNDPTVALAVANLGVTASARGDYARARSLDERAIAVFEKQGADNPRLAAVLSNLANLAKDAGKLDEALALYQRAVRIVEKAYGPQHPDAAEYMINMSGVLKLQGKLDDAAAVVSRALVTMEKAYGADHPNVGIGLANLGDIDLKRGDYTGALDAFQRSMAIFEAKLGKSHPHVSFAVFGVARSMHLLKRVKEAVPLFERALAIRTSAKMPPDLVADVRFELAKTLAETPRTRARGIAEAKTALAEYQKINNAKLASNIQQWLRTHP